MRHMEIYFSDLSEEAAKRYLEEFGRDENVENDCFPIAVIEQAEKEREAGEENEL